MSVLLPAVLVAGEGLDLAWGLNGAPAVLAVICGAGLIGAGFAVWAWTVRLFARIGKGTLAPWDPTQRLVVEGPYAYMRHPMITAVLLGQTAVFGAWA